MRHVLGYAGIPADIYNDVAQSGGRIAGADASFVGRPLPLGQYSYTPTYVEAFRSLFSNRLRKANHSDDEANYAAIFVHHEGMNANLLERALFPSVLAIGVEWAPVFGSRREVNEAKNDLVNRLRQASIRAKAALGVLKVEFSEQANRTPFLLPTRNFSSNDLVESLGAIQRHLPNAPNPAASLREERNRFERNHPAVLDTEWHPHQYFFTDHRNVRYRAPGKALHGVTHPETEGHPDACVLEGRRRLGAPFHHGFHYDCSRTTGSKLKGAFHQCHHGIELMTGNPHLNIAPNDFVRPGR